MTTVDNKKYFQAVDQLTALKTAPPFGLAFKPSLEQEFQQAQGVWYRETIKAAMLVAAVLLGIAHIVQSLSGVWVNPYAEGARFLSMALLLATCWYVSRAKVLTHQNTLVFANGLIATVVIIALSIFYPTPYKHISYTTLVFVLVFMFGYIRVPFNQAFFCTVLVILMTNLGLYVDQTPVSEWVFVCFVVISGAVVALMICYRHEKNARESFLKMLLMSMERDKLKRSNQKLEERLSTDSVTHLLNRRAFENTLLDEWNRAFQNQRKSHLVGINIVQFKRFNELKGTEAGDTLLRSIARQINQVMVESGDAAARISGGSFCIMISNCNTEELTRRVARLHDSLVNLPCMQDEQLAQENIRLELGVLTVAPSPEKDARDAIIETFSELQPVKRHSVVNQRVVS